MQIRFRLPHGREADIKYCAAITQETGVKCLVDLNRKEVALLIEPPLDELGRPQSGFWMSGDAVGKIIKESTELGLTYVGTVQDFRERLAWFFHRFLLL